MRVGDSTEATLGGVYVKRGKLFHMAVPSGEYDAGRSGRRAENEVKLNVLQSVLYMKWII